MKKCILIATLFSASISNAQDKSQTTEPLPDIAADLSALNTHFSGIATFRIDRDDRLITEYIDQGTAYRVDEAYLEFLNANGVTFNAEEHTVMVKCTEENLPTGQTTGKCIDKEVKKTGAISQTGRMNLPVPSGDANGAKAITMLGKLLRDSQQVLSNGTKSKHKRKN